MKMNKIIALSVVTSGLLVAGGYKVPEQSLNSMALGAAYVAHTSGADTAYFNPANMAFMEDKHYLDGALTWVRLPSNVYTPTNPALPFGGESETENIFIPSGHYVAKAIGDFRWGVSMVAPGGLTKRWKTPYQKLYAEEFTLKVIEINPSVSYKINENFAIAGGLRLIYSEGVVDSDGGSIAPIKREMQGDTIEFGYNLAMTYRPTNDINLAVTYRSNVDLQEEGQANLYFGGVGKQYDAEVTVPLPAALNLAISKTWNNNFTLEFNYERTYWSAYEELDFNYGSPVLNPILNGAFDTPLARDWKDTNTFRLGATYVMDKYTFMGAFAIDETPVPDRTIGFELPDSDAKIFSAGVRYQYSEDISVGIAFLYDLKDDRTLAPGVAENPIITTGGTFDEGGAFLTTLGMSYEF